MILVGRGLLDLQSAIPSAELSREDATGIITPEINQAVAIPGIYRHTGATAAVLGNSQPIFGTISQTGPAGALGVIITTLDRGLWELTYTLQVVNTLTDINNFNSVSLSDGVIGRTIERLVQAAGQAIITKRLNILLPGPTRLELDQSGAGGGNQCDLFFSCFCSKLL